MGPGCLFGCLRAPYLRGTDSWALTATAVGRERPWALMVVVVAMALLGVLRGTCWQEPWHYGARVTSMER